MPVILAAYEPQPASARTARFGIWAPCSRARSRLRPSADLEVSRCATWPHQGTPWRPSRRHVESNVVRTGVAAGISEWSSTASSATGGAAVFPEEVIAAHQHFIERRRTTRPFGELRTASGEEWAEFENHFLLRKVPLGDCHRPYGTPCVHEHACTRCRLLRSIRLSFPASRT